MDDFFNLKRYEVYADQEYIWDSGYYWGCKDTESEFQYDRFQEAEHLLAQILILEENMIEGDFEELKTFFRKRIEDNA